MYLNDTSNMYVLVGQRDICHPDKQEEVTMTDSWVANHDARPFNDRVVHNRNPISGKRNYLGFLNFREKMQQSRFDIINHGEPLVLRYRSN